MEHFKLKLNHMFIEHRRLSMIVRSRLPSTNCVTKGTISQSTNSESLWAKMGDTPTCVPILTILYLVSSCLYFHVKWRKARHFDARTVDSFLKRDWGSPCWPWMTWMVSKITQMLILSISNCEWQCPIKSAPENENMSTNVRIFSVYPINIQHT